MNNQITSKQILEMSYTDFVSFIKEENRPSGGKKSIREIVHNSFINQSSKVLEIGCTNGFSSLEVARLINCEVVGIDINPKSVNNANMRANNSKTDNVSFQVASAYDIPFTDNFFDLIITGNATSFMDKKQKAINEYIRVLKPWGFISATPIWYKKSPPREVIKQVSDTINSEIIPMTKNDWIKLFTQTELELYYCADYEFDIKNQRDIDEYVELSLKEVLSFGYSPEVNNSITERWREIITIFNHNLLYANYSAVLLRKRAEIEQKELFTTHPDKGL